MIFEQVATGGCQSYLVGCEATQAAVLIDPELSRIDHYRGLLNRHGLTLKYVIDTHTHADHFSASKELGKAFGVPVVMHRLSPAPHADLRFDSVYQHIGSSAGSTAALSLLLQGHLYL